MIAVYSSDRAWRQRIEGWLSTHAVAVRSASRPAELAKCLTDGRVVGIVAGPQPSDVADAARSGGSVPLVTSAPHETVENLGARVLQLLV